MGAKPGKCVRKYRMDNDRNCRMDEMPVKGREQ